MRAAALPLLLAACARRDPCGERAHLSDGICLPDADDPVGPDADAAVAAVGEPFAQLRLRDQHGDVFDLYDLAGGGSDVIVHIDAMWAQVSADVAEWISGDGSGYPEYAPLHEQVAGGETHWVTILTEDAGGAPPDVEDLALWAETFPHERIPVLAGDAVVAETYASAYPTLYLLDDSMRIVAMQGASGTPYDVLDAAAAR